MQTEACDKSKLVNYYYYYYYYYENVYRTKVHRKNEK